MFLLYEVVEQVSQKYFVIWVAAVHQRNLHGVVRGAHSPMEGTVDYEHPDIRSGRGDLPPDVRQLILPPLPEFLGVLGADPDGGVGGAVEGEGRGLHVRVGGGGAAQHGADSSASKSSIRRFVITEKAPTRAFAWLKAATTAFTFKTLLRHYAKRAMTP